MQATVDWFADRQVSGQVSYARTKGNRQLSTPGVTVLRIEPKQIQIMRDTTGHGFGDLAGRPQAFSSSIPHRRGNPPSRPIG